MTDEIPQILQRMMTEAAPIGQASISPANEAEYRLQWHALLLGERTPHSLALAGGYLASQLPWVFMAGYQAAIRWVFPDVKVDGWLAFAASEDRSSDAPLAGVSISETGELNGFKTWVAGVNSIDGLLILVKGNDAGPTRVFELHSSVPGLTLHGPEGVPGKEKFLAAMSQGKAELAGVPVSQLDEPSVQRLRWFRYAEAISVYTALGAFLLRASQLLESDQLRDAALGALRHTEPAFAAEDEQALAAAAGRIVEDTIACAHRYEAIVGDDAPGNWAVDRRLIEMYAPRN